jgi:hypothetical protein
VNDFLAVHVFAGVDELLDEVADFRLRQRLARLQHVDERLPRTILKDDVDIFFVLEVTVELDDVMMAELRMQFDFPGDFFPLMRFRYSRFGNDFTRVETLRRCVDQLVAPGETALA